MINQPCPLWETPPDEFARLMEVNVCGVFHGIRAFVPAMIARGSGVIVNLSSGWGRSTSPEVAPYCATKWGIEGLTQSLAQELPAGLAAVALNPGIIDTDMLRACFGDGAAQYRNAERLEPRRRTVPGGAHRRRQRPLAHGTGRRDALPHGQTSPYAGDYVPATSRDAKAS